MEAEPPTSEPKIADNAVTMDGSIKNSLAALTAQNIA
jgi:hypothetical protein